MKIYVVELVNSVLQDPYFQDTALYLAKDIVKKILADEYTNEQLVVLITKYEPNP